MSLLPQRTLASVKVSQLIEDLNGLDMHVKDKAYEIITEIMNKMVKKVIVNL